MADIIITPAASIMAFTSSLGYKETLTQEASGSLTLQGSGSTGRTDLFTVNGNNGTLFSVSDDLSNSLFSVNTIAGLPVIEAFANNTVVMGAYGQNDFIITGSKVGIGTASPSAKLHTSVNDNSFSPSLYLENTNTGSSALSSIIFKNASQGVASIYQQNSNGDLGFYNSSTSGKINLLTNATNRVTIDSTGNVGIGTTSPSYKLDVNGNVYVASSIYVATSITATSSKLYWNGANTFFAGGEDITATTISTMDEGITSVSNGTSLDGWTDLRYNGTVLSQQFAGGSALYPGQLIALRSNNTWEPADADTTNSTLLLGIALTFVGASGGNLSVLLEGQVSTYYHDQLGTSTPGYPLYISPTAGNITETAPSGTGQYVRLIGHNIYENNDVVVIRFNPDNIWIEL